MKQSSVYVGDMPVTNKCLRMLLRSWTPRPTVATTVWTYGIISVLMVIFSIILFVYNSHLPSYTYKDYDNVEACKQMGSACSITINLQTHLPGPLYLQYGLTNFQQNNKKYLNSRSGSQLFGEIIDESQAKRTCDIVVYNKNLYKKTSYGGVPLDPQGIANPCGFIAKSVFNDTYSLSFQNGTNIFINETGISWPFDNGRKFRKPVNSSSIQWIDPTDQHFMVWMRVSSRTDFIKPWGIIKQGLKAGTYIITINNNFDADQYNSHKYLVLSSVGSMGAQNYTIPIVMLVFGVVFIVGCIVFLIKYKITGGKFGPKVLL